ncbi:MAG: SUMF1/EgtB/PvdO family nonheme iron enzyme, partial [Polyangiaceae bacterium]
MNRGLAPILAIGIGLFFPSIARHAAAQADGHKAPDPVEDGAEEDNPYDTPPVPSAAPSASAKVRPLRIPIPFQDGMLRLPGGKFTMGSADPLASVNERPPHAVTVAPFWIDKTEVSVRAFRACVDKRQCIRPAKASLLCTYDLDDPELPVSCMRWSDADAYCRASGKRLPREAEFEFAARGLAAIRYPWGAAWTNCTTAVTLLSEGTSKSCAGKRPSPVGTHPLGASAFGVLDLSGNVEEWTSDWYAESLAEGASPRSGASHVLRGGGWLSTPSASRMTTRN